MKFPFLLCLIASLLPTLALAQIESGPEPQNVDAEDQEIFEPSKYGGLGLAIGVEQYDLFPGVDFDEGFGADVVLGSRWHPYFSVEAQFVYMQGIEIDRANVEFEYEVFTANLRFHPFPGVVEPYAFVGLGMGRVELDVGFAKDDEWGSVFRFGGGAELNINRTFAVTVGADYLLTTGDIKDLDLVEIKVGVISRFW